MLFEKKESGGIPEEADRKQIHLRNKIRICRKKTARRVGTFENESFVMKITQNKVNKDLLKEKIKPLH